MMGADDVLETLLLPFISGQLQWNNDALFLRARSGASLSKVANKQLICEQSFKPEAEALQRAGFKVSPEFSEISNDGKCQTDNQTAHPELVEGFQKENQNGSILRPAQNSPRADKNRPSSAKFSLILILPSRQRDEAHALYARAVSLLKPGGVIAAAASNNEGARSLESDLEKLTGNINTLSKNKCRVFWSIFSAASVNPSLQSQWSAIDTIRPILNSRFQSRPGVFAWDRIDIASALLAQHLPTSLAGVAADLGSGFGFLSDELLQRCKGITALHVYEAEHRALQLSQLNLARYEARLAINYHWHDVTAGLLHQYDVIVTNPPFHTHSRMDRPDIGRRFITVAAQSLNPGGQLWLVANRHLPYEEVLVEGFDSVKVIAEKQGFKVIAATKVAAAVRKARK